VCITNLNIDLLIVCISLSLFSVRRLSYFLSHADIHSSGFGGKCISDESKLEERNQEITTIKCTRCNRDLVKEASAPPANVYYHLSVKTGTYLTD
jgi:hypothetical protein